MSKEMINSTVGQHHRDVSNVPLQYGSWQSEVESG